MSDVLLMEISSKIGCIFDMLVDRLVLDLLDGKFNSIDDCSSNKNVQYQVATSERLINSNKCGVALDWIINNGFDLNLFFSKFDGFNHKVESNCKISKFLSDAIYFNLLLNCKYGLYLLSTSSEVLRYKDLLKKMSTSIDIDTSCELNNLIVYDIVVENIGMCHLSIYGVDIFDNEITLVNEGKSEVNLDGKALKSLKFGCYDGIKSNVTVKCIKFQ